MNSQIMFKLVTARLEQKQCKHDALSPLQFIWHVCSAQWCTQMASFITKGVLNVNVPDGPHQNAPCLFTFGCKAVAIALSGFS